MRRTSRLLLFLALGYAEEVCEEDDDVASTLQLREEQPYYDLIVAIPCSSHDISSRDLVTKTWGSYLNASGHCPRCQSARTVRILLGTSAAPVRDLASEEERRQHSAQLAVLPTLVPQQDNYHNLTAKIRLMLEYAVHNFRFSLLLKADTDSFVFMDRFLAAAEKMKLFEDQGFYGGHWNRNVTPLSKGRWADHDFTRITGNKVYPPYALGAGYVLSASLVQHIASLRNLQPLPNEDVAVGFWLQPVVHRKVDLQMRTKPFGCRNRKFLVDHQVPADEMLRRGRMMQEQGDPCAGDWCQYLHLGKWCRAYPGASQR